MGPPRVIGGYAVASLGSVSDPVGFNGAAESNRRIHNHRSIMSPDSRRFNGAAESNRRIRADRVLLELAAGASMGPPRVIGGYVSSDFARMASAPSSLQWGRRE